MRLGNIVLKDKECMDESGETLLRARTEQRRSTKGVNQRVVYVAVLEHGSVPVCPLSGEYSSSCLSHEWEWEVDMDASNSRPISKDAQGVISR